MVDISDEINVKKVFVQRRGNRYYFPKTLPRERNNTIYNVILVTWLLILFVHLYIDTDYKNVLAAHAIVVLFNCALCLIYRSLLCYFQNAQKRSCYDNSFRRIVREGFFFEAKTYIVAFLSIIYMVYYLSPDFNIPTFNWTILLYITCTSCLWLILNWNNFPINDSLYMAKGNGLNCGSGMAYSFFYGYVKYMLEKIGNPNRNLKEMLEDYESSNNIRFDVHKIFILIPKSFQCRDYINEVSNIMEARSPLPEKTISVAGVRDRVYKHSVYSISVKSREVYVCTEYATPLKTFKEVFDHSTAHSECYKRHKNDILLQFYLTLKRILEETKMDDMCELIYYEDLDENGKYYDVGKILLSKIREINKTEKPKFD